jgi:C4-dicarboxylate-specific signal transduction histidine kinase
MIVKILNVDADDASRQAKSRTLQHADYTVLEAASGADALWLVRTEQPELVLLDVRLPDMSGYEVCRRIKSNPATATVIVVQMSATFAPDGEHGQSLEECADAYMTAPVQPTELVATIRALLRLRQAEVELRQTRDALEARVHARTAELQRAIKALRRQNTRRALSEQALQTSYQFLQSTLDALSSHIAILNEAGAILEVNASWQQFIAVHDVSLPFDSHGMAFDEFFTTVAGGCDAPSVHAVITGTRAVLAQQRQTFSCEYTCQRQPEPLWFLVRVTRFDAPQGARAVVVIENITEVKRAEANLRHQQEALYQSERLATMGALLASVAHELNNPLGVAQMQLDLLAEELKDSDLQEHITELQQVTGRCIRIVQNFLTLARRNPPQRTAVQLNAVVEAGLQLLAHTLRLDSVIVHQHLAADLPLIGADASQLQQVVVNLLLNAQQVLHHVAAPRWISLTTWHDAARARVVLQIADSGPGIPAGLRARIFEPFFTTKPVGIGTGLGLSVCQGIIESHGGTIRVDHQPGAGAVFCIELPVEAVTAPEPPAPEPLAPASPPSTILIVDDEIGIVRGLARLLRRDGHQVDTASNGRQALGMLHEREYDLILCDLRMPELDGPGVYRAVGAFQPQALQRFIFLTGDTLSPEAGAFLEQTGMPRLIKPFSAADGRRVVQQALSALR